MFKLCLIGLVFLAAGCARKMYESRTNETFAGTSTTHTSVSVSEEKIVEKDTTRRVVAPVEHSRNEVSDSSYLSTSLSWSQAVWRNGRLIHQIGNLPEISVPAKIIYRDRWRARSDTLIIRDTLRTTENVYIEKKVTPAWINILYWGFAIAAGIIIYRKFFRR